MNFLRDLLKEQSGKYSSKRVMSLLWFMAVLMTWVSVCIKNSKIEDIPNGVYMISGVIFATQAVGKFGEK